MFLLSGEDQTSQVLEMQSQVQSSGGSKRRKRQAEAEIPKETTAINSTQVKHTIYTQYSFMSLI